MGSFDTYVVLGITKDYQHVENPVLEQFPFQFAGLEPRDLLSSEKFSYDSNELNIEKPLSLSEMKELRENSTVGDDSNELNIEKPLSLSEMKELRENSTVGDDRSIDLSLSEMNSSNKSPAVGGDSIERILSISEMQSLLESRDCNFGTPSKMMNDHSLIIPDSHMDHPSFMGLKTQGMEEVVLDTNHVSQLFFNDSGVPNELIVEQSIEVGNEDPHAEIILVPNTTIIKQEDMIEGGEVVVASSVDNEVIIDDHMDSHLDTDHFVIGSSIDIGSDQMDDGFDDTKLIIDTDQYGIEANLTRPCITYDCGECGVTCKSRASLKKHVESQHPKYQRNEAKKTSSKEKSSGTKWYTCPSCSYSSQRRDKLDKHMEKHVLLDGVHPCGKKRHKPEALPRRHRHNAEEYRCPHCAYCCTVYEALTKHKKVHLSNKAFTLKLSCKICGEDRTTKAEIQRHMKKHKTGDHLQCDLCPFTSVQLKKIIQHRRMHTGEKPHLCPHCIYRSSRRDNLRSHVRRMHGKENMYIDTFNPNEAS